MKQKRTPSIGTRLRYFIWRRWRYFVPLLAIVLALPFLIPQRVRHDRLVYTISDYYEYPASLFVYNPNTDVSTPLLTDEIILSFTVSANGQLAYVSRTDGQTEIFVRENLEPDTPSINISQSGYSYKSSGLWSPDGQSMVYTTAYESDSSRVFVWDGQTTTDITPHDTSEGRQAYYSVWSPDSRYLAIVQSDFETNRGKIYLWDGQTTTSLDPDNDVCFASCDGIAWSADGRLAFTADISDANADVFIWDNGNFINLSQNLENYNINPRWSPNGAVAFMSYTGEYGEVVLCDGQSMSDGRPDTSTFMKSSMSFYQGAYFSGMGAWTPDGKLVLYAEAEEDENIQIYVWDGEQAINISQNPDRHNSRAIWSPNGMWVFIQHSGGQYQEGLFVRDADNNTIFAGGMGYTAWSSDGDLSFCNSYWSLNLWNGDRVTEIAHGSVINAQWQSGMYATHCSSG